MTSATVQTAISSKRKVPHFCRSVGNLYHWIHHSCAGNYCPVCGECYSDSDYDSKVSLWLIAHSHHSPHVSTKEIVTIASSCLSTRKFITTVPLLCRWCSVAAVTTGYMPSAMICLVRLHQFTYTTPTALLVYSLSGSIRFSTIARVHHDTLALGWGWLDLGACVSAVIWPPFVLTDEAYEILSELPESVVFHCQLCRRAGVEGMESACDGVEPAWRVAVNEYMQKSFSKVSVWVGKC